VVRQGDDDRSDDLHRRNRAFGRDSMNLHPNTLIFRDLRGLRTRFGSIPTTAIRGGSHGKGATTIQPGSQKTEAAKI
jgi:hypothetical protein